MAFDGVAEFLRRLMLRSPLSAAEQRAVLHLSGQRCAMVSHQDIVTPGQTVDHACLVVSGLAGRFDLDAEGHRQITAFYLPGDMCDLHSLPSPHTGWGISALVPMTILRIPHAELRAVVSQYNALALALWRDSVVDASILAKWLAIFAHKTATARLAHLLCEMGIRMETVGLGAKTHFQFAPTQEQLADTMGLTTVHVNRTLQALRKDGLVKCVGQVIEILDWPRLAEIAKFDPTYLLLRPQRTNFTAQIHERGIAANSE
jgi:CRP-like cAMP-binding protein